MSIWFRIEYDDADKYKICCRIGNVEFTSDLGYFKGELPDVIMELAKVNTDDD